MNKISFLLSKILPPEEKIFFELFENGALNVYESAQLYHNIVFDGLSDEKIEKSRELKATAIKLAKQTLLKLNETFITPIEREDIQLISSLLCRITKKITRACSYLKVYNLDKEYGSLLDQCKFLEKATLELRKIISLLKEKQDINKITESYHNMIDIENHGDQILFKAFNDLFNGNNNNAITIIKLRDIYKDIEKALDACFSISDTIVNVVLKHS